MEKSSTLQRTFVGLYTVVMAFALERGAESFITFCDEYSAKPGGNLLQLIQVTLALLALLFTMLPFYHGTCRHWELSYSDRTLQKRHHLMHADFYMAMVHALIFLFMGAHLAEPQKLNCWFHVLLIWNIFALTLILWRLRRAHPTLRIWGPLDFLHDVRGWRTRQVSNTQVFSIERLNAWIMINLGCLASLLICDYLVMSTLCIWECPYDPADANASSVSAKAFWVFIGIAVIRSLLDHLLSDYGRIEECDLSKSPISITAESVN